MPTENRSNDADGWIACDDGLHLIQMDKNLSHYGWVFRKVDGGLPYSVREATAHEMAHAQARQHLRIGVAQIAGQAPAPQPHPEPASYPPCDYCGTVPSYHPWHGSGMLNGVENRHIHACDGCRGQLPSHPGQPHPEPIAWMVGTAIWWTKEEAERDAAETGLPIVGLGPMTDAAEVERLREALKFYADRDHFAEDIGSEWDSVSGEPANVLWHEDEAWFVEDGSIARAALERRPEKKSI